MMIFIGKIGAPHGLKGEVKVKTCVPEAREVLAPGTRLYLKNGDALTIRSRRPQQEVDLLAFEGFSSIDNLDPIRGQDLFLNRDEVVLPEGVYFDQDLLGLKVYRQEEFLGEITEVFWASPKNRVIRIGETLLIPCQEHFIKKIDLASGQMEVFLEEGMIE